ncbi:hypothetical protein RB595_003090 [Gaeumannomyces hyphopodioides]
MDQRDLEKEATPELAKKPAEAPPSCDASSASDEDEPEYAPIRNPPPSAVAGAPRPPSSKDGGADLNRPLTAASSASRRSVSRVRSHNGYGCDDDHDDDSDGNKGADGSAAGGPGQSPERDPFEVCFEKGEKDPLCPRSMGIARKWMIVLVTSCGSLCVTCASSIYTSSYGPMNAEFGCSNLVATIGLSTFVLGIAMGPAWSPLSELYGRRPIYLASFLLFTVWVVPSAVAPNIETMIVARFFQGFTGSAFLSVSGGTVSDLFSKQDMSLPMAVFTLAPFIGPCVGPLAGGFINTYTGWRWTHWVLLIWGLVLLVVVALFVPETYHPVLLRDRARALRAETGDDRWLAPMERRAAAAPRQSVAGSVARSLLRPFQMLASEPICVALDLYSAILLGILYLFFGAFPLVFSRNHGFELWQTGMTFLGLLVGMVAGVFTDPYWQRARARLVAALERETGVEGASEPEFHLPCVMAGGVLTPVGLFLFGWTTFPWVHWIVPLIGSVVFGTGYMLAFKGIFTYLVDAYPTYSASAIAANVFVRCAFAAAFPLFGIQMYNALGYQWATSLLAFLTVAMMPFPFIFFYYGKKIRARSRYAAP